MMARECERVGLPAPTFSQDGIVVKTTFARPYDTSDNTVGVSKSKLGVQQEQSYSTSNSASNDTSKVTSATRLTNDGIALKTPLLKLIGIIGEDWLSLYDMLGILNFTSRFSFTKTYLKPAIEAGLITLENPDKPNVPNQRYGLTLKGKALYYDRHDDKIDAQNDVQNDDHDAQSIESRIIEIIKAEPDIRRDHIAEKLNISRKTAERLMQKLGIAWLGHPKTGHWVFVSEI